MKNWKSYLNPLWVFILASMGSRWPTFFNYLDKDEGTYIAIGQELNSGAQLYLDVLDLKPPLGLWLFQWMEFLFDEHVFLYRLLLSILIGIIACMIFVIQQRMGGSELAAWFSGTLFIFLHYFQFALTFNFEFLMIFFTVLGVLLYVTMDKKLVAGLSIGLAFCVKYLCLMDFLALALLVVYDHRKNLKIGQWRNSLAALWRLGVGFAIPFLFVNIYFAYEGFWNEFSFISYVAPGNYSSNTSFLEKLDFIFNFHLTHLFYLLLFYIALFSKKLNPRQKWFYFSWFLAAIVGTQLTGQQFKHYLIQTVPALALMAGCVVDIKHSWFNSITSNFSHENKLSRKAIFVMTLLFLIAGIFNYFDHFKETAPLQKIGTYLEDNLEPSDNIYAANCCAYLYSKCDRRPLNEYIHGRLFVRDVHIRTLNIDVDKELKEIQRARPEYVILKNEYRWPSFKKFLDEEYELVFQADRGYSVLKRSSLSSK